MSYKYFYFFQPEQTESNINSDSLSILCIVVDYVSGKNVFKTWKFVPCSASFWTIELEPGVQVLAHYLNWIFPMLCNFPREFVLIGLVVELSQ